MPEGEILIKNKRRVQQHGEVFTPLSIVNAMISLPGLDEALKQITTTVLEPSVGEGVFLTNILDSRLQLLEAQFGNDIIRFENYALLSLTTLYGIELLEDNAQKCVINIYVTFYDFYKKIAANNNDYVKANVLESAKTIISANIVQGNFLTRELPDGKPIVFSEWKPSRLTKRTKNIKVTRTEYTLDDIYSQVSNNEGSIFKDKPFIKQISIFESWIENPKFHYITAKITDTYKQEMEEID